MIDGEAVYANLASPAGDLRHFVSCVVRVGIGGACVDLAQPPVAAASVAMRFRGARRILPHAARRVTASSVPERWRREWAIGSSIQLGPQDGV